MKKFLIAAVAASVIATPAAAAPRYDHGQTRVVKTVKVKPHRTVTVRKTVKHQRANYRHWAKGQRFDRRYANNYRVVNYRYNQRLYAPPRGYQWVQSGNDAVLVALASGLIGAVIGGAF